MKINEAIICVSLIFLSIQIHGQDFRFNGMARYTSRNEFENNMSRMNFDFEKYDSRGALAFKGRFLNNTYNCLIIGFFTDSKLKRITISYLLPRIDFYGKLPFYELLVKIMTYEYGSPTQAIIDVAKDINSLKYFEILKNQVEKDGYNYFFTIWENNTSSVFLQMKEEEIQINYSYE
ncbi:MAG: hypothetical protein LBP76_07670 [Treponema sp.]|nr:hypothetical protein [Treponema sp.]